MRAFSAQSFAPFAFSAMAWAIEGLLEEIEQPPAKPPESGGGGAVRHAQQEAQRRRKRLAELERQRRVRQNNELILATVMASLTQGLIA
jgi:hypothetical protein